MEIIKRDLLETIKKHLFKHKIISIYGARQVGKTTLIRMLMEAFSEDSLYLDADILHIRQSLEQQDPVALKRVIGNKKLVCIDEAQRIENIGLILKILHNYYPETQIIATGSSSFELANKINEPLTGRAIEFILFPLSIHEIQQEISLQELPNQLEFLLTYGSYPDIVTASKNEARLYLENLATKYLYKDILEFEALKKPALLVKLLQLLAFQLGNEVSKHELAVNLQTNPPTIDRYLDLLEKAFVIFRLRPLSRNLRKEITKKEKIYFYDLGIRNSLISNFTPLAFREDRGALWENFCIVERMKYRQRKNLFSNIYFWRTHDQKEIDYIEEYDGAFHAFEFKWKSTSYKIPKDFMENYNNPTFKLITTENMLDFLLD